MKKKYKRILALFLFLNLNLASFAENPFMKSKNQNGDEFVSSKRAVMIVLDASGSMSEEAENGKTKIFAAKQVLEKVLSELDSSVKVGLRVYGSSEPSFDPFEKCQDTLLLVSPALNNRAKIINELRNIKPSGATPISLAMRRAIDDLKSVSAEQKSVVLISDGMDTCGYDPCSLAESMRENNLNVQFNVVGFGIKNDFNAIEQLQCIAKSTDGQFYTADTSAELTEGITDGLNRYSLNVNAEIEEVR